MKKFITLAVFLLVILSANAQEPILGDNIHIYTKAQTNEFEKVAKQAEYYDMIMNQKLPDLVLNVADYAKLRNTSKLIEVTGVVLMGFSLIASKEGKIGVANGLMIGGSVLSAIGWTVDLVAIQKIRLLKH